MRFLQCREEGGEENGELSLTQQEGLLAFLPCLRETANNSFSPPPLDGVATKPLPLLLRLPLFKHIIIIFQKRGDFSRRVLREKKGGREKADCSLPLPQTQEKKRDASKRRAGIRRPCEDISCCQKCSQMEALIFQLCDLSLKTRFEFCQKKCLQREEKEDGEE